MSTRAAAKLASLFCLWPVVCFAQATPEVDACRATGLVALKADNPAISDIFIDPESLTISATDTKIEDTPVKTIILADAYLQKGTKSGPPYKLICIIGDKGKVLLTYFTHH